MRLGESMKTYAEVDRQVIPIIGKCLDGIVKAAESIDQKNVSAVVWTSLTPVCGPGFPRPLPRCPLSICPCQVVAFRGQE